MRCEPAGGRWLTSSTRPRGAMVKVSVDTRRSRPRCCCRITTSGRSAPPRQTCDSTLRPSTGGPTVSAPLSQYMRYGLRLS
jgi:hypothetical protein